MKFLITGGEGFIGRNVKRLLSKENHEVLTLDVVGEPDFRVNVQNFDDVLKCTNGMDGIFHLAAVTSPPQFEEDLFSGFNTNVNGTLNVLKAAAESGVGRVILASSSSVYPDTYAPAKEDLRIVGHKNMYSTTKLFDEYLGKYFTLRDELEVIPLRYFNVYGIGENTKGLYSSIMSKFLESIIKKQNPVIFGDGNQSRDFIYVEDVAEATIMAFIAGSAGEVYNIGTGVSTKFNDIVRIMSEVLDSEIRALYERNPFKNYQYFTQADNTKAKNQLGWKPKYSLKDGIREMAIHLGLI